VTSFDPITTVQDGAATAITPSNSQNATA
jgi:hypothetical protein